MSFRARRRRSRWNLALIPAGVLSLAAIWTGLVWTAAAVHRTLFPGQSLDHARGFWPIVTVVAPFFGALPLSLLIANSLVRLVPSARAALDAEADAGRSPSYVDAQRALRRLAVVLLPLAAAASLFGALLPW